ncbi:MAG: hypothetical protein ACEQSB_04435 [Undibacterium sp.]
METKQKQKRILFAGLTLLVLAGILLYVASFLDRNTTAIKNMETPKEELTGAAAYSATLPPSYWFLLEPWGYSPPTDEDDTPVQMSVVTGAEVPIGAGVNEYAVFDPANVRITVLGDAGTRELPTTPKPEDGMVMYIATYVPEKPGKELITIEILGTPHREFVEVSAYSKELLGETGLTREDISWKDGGPVDVDTVKPSTGKLDDKDAPWGLDEPGYLRIQFTDELIKTKGEMKVYDISALERHRNGEPLTYFYEHILKLEQHLTNQEELSPDERHSLYDFPPINASMRRLDRDQIVRGSEFDGISYAHAGYFQSYDPAQQPTYIYQGISHDKKFFIYYSQELYSEALRKYLRKNDRCFEKECIEGSFSVLQHDKGLDPNPFQLNELVKSLKIRKQ